MTDLKKTVSQLGNLLKKQPFNLNLKNNFLTRSKECKKLTKKKTKQYKKELFDKLSALRDTDPKQYWKLLKSLKYEDSSKNIELQDGFEDFVIILNLREIHLILIGNLKIKLNIIFQVKKIVFLLMKLQTSRLLLLKLINA